jgi:D-3-phosphoglycerate dehydrogenase
VITDCDHDDVEPEREVLVAAGLGLRLAECRTAADVIAEGWGRGGADRAVRPHRRRRDRRLPAVRVLARYGVGVDNVDLDAAAAAGVWVANVPDYGTEEVADHALALVYALLRAIPRLDRAVRSGDWDVTAVRPLRRVSTLTSGSSVPGASVAPPPRRRAASGFASSWPTRTRRPWTATRSSSLEDLLRTADIVSVHAPLTAATRHLIDAAALGRMRPGSYLVNTARGGLVDVDAVLEALTSGQLAGAAIDVLEHEPPGPDFALAAHPRAIVTPHAAWYSEESYRTLKQEAAREVVRVLEGGRPRSPVNEPVGEAG